MDQKYLLLLIFPRCFTIPVNNDDCVTYRFEEVFYSHFSPLFETCRKQWKLGNYNSIPLESPHLLSRTFISPTNLLSCSISYEIPMSASGIVEVNLYMQPKSRNDNITIKVYKVAKALNTIVGAKTISPRSKDFKSGWETVKISLSGFGTFMGRLLLMGKAAQDSIVLIDSFRYIPPAYDESLCLIYDSSLYIDDSTTEFLYTTTLEETKDQITQESDPIVETSDKTTTPFTKIDNAMNMLDSTTQFLYTTTLEETKDQITQESSDPIVETSDKTTTPFTKIDNTMNMLDSTTEFLYTTTLEETKDQITQESDPIVETSDKTTTPFTKIDNAMNMLDSTTEFIYTTTLEETKDQITQESSDPIVETSKKTTTPFTKIENDMNMLDSTTEFLYTTTLEETKDQITQESSDPIVETSDKTTTPFTKTDNTVNMLDSTTQFLYTTTLEETKDQITQESDPIVETSDKTTTPFTKIDNAMNMLDSTTQFIYTTTSEETKDIQTTKEQPYSYPTIMSNTTLDMYITDFPTKPQTIETTSQQDDKDWDNSLTQSTTMVPTTIGDENDAFTLAPTNSKNKIETLTERNVATFLPETLDNSTSNIITNFRTTSTTSISSETAESISTGAIINTELTTELGSNTLKEVSDVEITTTENVNYATSLWDFNLDPENSTVAGTKGTEYTETVTSPEVSTKDELIINMINKGVTTTGPKLTTKRTKTDVTSAKILKNFDNTLTTDTDDLETSFKDRTIVTNKVQIETLQTDLHPQTTTIVIPYLENVDSDFLANFSIYSVV
ncbi:PREDICTED: uncharacterized protein PB18E9.04c-like, partial [Papilio xuthus]|uniref:Uncharacterized protein PB18E9.04c-like n=1 Tax=Papilio xuthus TaxID=66420 RepID=A0AAJ7EAQ5_PAPXU